MVGAFKITRGRPAVAPSNLTTPVVTGLAETGQTATGTPGTYSGTMPITLTHQWTRAGTPISGATGLTYVYQVADEGLAIVWDEVATNIAGAILTHSNTTVPHAAGAIPNVAPATGWNGTTTWTGRTPPVDPTRTTAKPAVRMIVPWSQRVTPSGLLLAVDAEAVGGMSGIQAWVEGSTANLNELVISDVDVNNKPRSRIGWWVNIVLTPTQQALYQVGTEMEVYFTGTANDGSMQQRVIGPYSFWPRATLEDAHYTIAKSGGANFTKLEDAFQQAVADAREAPNFHFTEGGTYEMVNTTFLNSYTGWRGYAVVDAAAGQTVTMGRAVFPYGQSIFSGGYWDTGIPNCEFRGSNIILNFHNLFQIHAPDGIYFPGLPAPSFNGCQMLDIDPATGLENSYKNWRFNGTNRPATGISVVQCFMQDCTIKDIGSALAGTWIARGNNILRSFGEIAPNSAYVANNYLDNWYPFDFFYPVQMFSLTYSGAGTGRMWVTGVQGTGAQMHFSVNGTEIVTGGFPISLGYYTLTDPLHEISQVVAAINTHGSGWAATALMADGPSACFMDGVNGNGPTPTIVDNSGTAIVNYSTDFHQDFWHTINQTGHNTVEGSIIRGNTIIGDDLYNTTAPAFIRGDTGVKDLMILENAMAHSKSTGFGGASSHVYIRRNNLGTGDGSIIGWQPGNCDAYSLFEGNTTGYQWTSPTGFQSGPVYVENYITCANNPTYAAAALSGGGNSGNIVSSASNAADMTAQLLALTVNPYAGDFRPTGQLLVSGNKITPITPLDMFYNTEATPTDAIGPMSVNAPKVTWPF